MPEPEQPLALRILRCEIYSQLFELKQQFFMIGFRIVKFYRNSHCGMASVL